MPTVVFWLIAAFAQSRFPSVNQVAWLRGCWETQTREGSIEAQWLSPRASSMLGVSRTIHGTTLVDYEMALIRAGGERLAYEAHPSNDQPALFMSIAIADRRIAFENLKPGYPARIGYELTAAGRLVSWSEGTRDGQTRRTETAYDRVSCPGE